MRCCATMQIEYKESVRPGSKPGAISVTSRLRRWAFAAWVAGCAIVAGIILAREPLGWLQARFLNERVIQFLGGVGYVLFDIEETARNRWRTARLDQVDPTPYRDYLKSLAARRQGAPVMSPALKHVVYLQMESADGLLIGSRYKGRPLMPFLDKLSREAVHFANAIDNTASGRTTDCELLVLTSQVPLRRAPAYVSQPLDRVPSLPKILKAAGYRTWSMHGYDGSFWRREAAHRAIGFDDMFFREDLDAGDRIGWGISDHSVLRQAARRLAVAREPTFAHVILLTNHHPYPYVRASKGFPDTGIVADYVHSVGYMDECVEEFFGELRAAGVLDNCIIAVFGDHDSSITERLDRELQDVPPRVVSDTVPLIIHGLREAPRRIEAVAGLQDVPVVVLEALGLPVPPTFTGNGIEGGGRTVGAMLGAVEGTAQGLRSFPLPIDQEMLTLLALRHPEKLLEQEQ